MLSNNNSFFIGIQTEKKTLIPCIVSAGIITSNVCCLLSKLSQWFYAQLLKLIMLQNEEGRVGLRDGYVFAAGKYQQ